MVLTELMPTWSKIKKGVRNPKDAYTYIRSNMSPLYLLESPYLFFTSRYPIGTHVLEREWDVLIVLDTCRVDALRYVADEYNFLDKDNIGRIWSLGGTSPEWIAHTFSSKYRAELSNTGYITANPHSKTVLEGRKYNTDEHSFAAKRFYRYGEWDYISTDDLGYYDPLFSYQKEVKLDNVKRYDDITPPRYMTDRAIATWREQDLDRLILHYMQPHYPWVSNAINESRDLKDYEKRPKASVKFGNKLVFNSYLDDLRYVLEDIKVLLNNIEADTVAISADHGDAFGEWGVYGHDPGRFHPKVRYVPWAITSGTDKGEYEPQIEMAEKEKDTTNVEQLEALGYR